MLPRVLPALLLAVLLSCAPELLACRADPADGRPRTGLVLGGGGARGGAHIGVLKVLERERIPVDCVTGTSMGSIVGGLYAAGFGAAEIERILTTVDWRDLFDDDPPRRELPLRRKQNDLDLLIDLEIGFDRSGIKPPRGILQGEKLFLLLRRTLISTTAVEHFDQLPIPFRAIAAELESGKGVVFEDGDLANAIRASMSVPGFFQPIRVRGKLLIDGGIYANVPIHEARAIGAQRLIVIDVGTPPLAEDQIGSPLAVANQVIATMMQRQTDATLATLTEADLLLRPDLAEVGSADFDLTPQAIAAGERAAEAMLPQLRRYAVDATAWAAFEARHQPLTFDNPQLGFVRVNSKRSRTSRYVSDRLGSLAGQALDFDRVDDVIKRVYGEGRHERITYDLVERDGVPGLLVTPVDKGWGPNFFRFGLSLSDDFAGDADYRLGIEARVTGLSSGNMEWLSRIDLGASAGLRSELNMPFGRFRQFYLEPGIEISTSIRPLGLDRRDPQLAQYRVRRRTLDLEAGYDYDENLRIYARLLRGDDLANRSVGAPELGERIESDAGGIGLGFLRDTLDDASFPSSGSRMQAELTGYLQTLGADSTTRVVQADWDKALKRGQHRIVLGLHGSDTVGDGEDNELVLRSYSRIGGLGNLSGYAEEALVGERTLLGRLLWYRSFDDGTRLFTLPVYIGATLEAGQVRTRSPGDDDWIAAGSLFFGADTPLGPIYLGYGRADTGADSFYLRFGSLIRSREGGF